MIGKFAAFGKKAGLKSKPINLQVLMLYLLEKKKVWVFQIYINFMQVHANFFFFRSVTSVI